MKFNNIQTELQEMVDLKLKTEQGEQKPAYKVEPKFKVGDWVVCEAAPKFTAFKTGDVVQISNKETLKMFLMFEDCFRLWDIVKDTKDGDMLCTYECGTPKIVFILKGTPKKHYALSYHCYYNIMYPHFESDSEKGCLSPNDEDVKPATKEQRDLLFKKMGEAGYTWDAAKLELKKIEQKPVNLVAILNDYFANTPKEQQDKDWEELKHLNNFGLILVEQKPAWSGEYYKEKGWLSCRA